MTSRSMFLAAALGALCLTAPANAKTDRNGAESGQRVTYGDLDLSTAEGFAKLQQRLDKAARKACRVVDNGAMRDSQLRSACLRDTRRDLSVQTARLMADHSSLGG